MNGFLVGSNGWGIMILFFGYASGGKLCYYIFAEAAPAAGFCLLRSHGEGGSGVIYIGGAQWQKCDKMPLA